MHLHTVIIFIVVDNPAQSKHINERDEESMKEQERLNVANQDRQSYTETQVVTTSKDTNVGLVCD
jgi:hypothetical protein